MGRNFVLGDLHGNESGESKYLWFKYFPIARNLTKEDVVIQLGDFSYIWFYNPEDRKFQKDQKMLDLLSKLNFTLFVVPGNHDNFDLINSLPQEEKFKGIVYVYTSLSGNKIYFAKRGEVYIINGKKFFTFSGAASSDIKSRNSLQDHLDNPKKIKIGKVNFWPMEIATEEEMEFARENIAKHNYKFDYIVTHTCPSSLVGEFIHKTKYTELKFTCSTSKFLEEINNVIEAKEWHFGHMHTNHIHMDLGIKFQCHYKTPPFELI